ncbi:uncharacterized protein EAE97_010889 [Botrytis byssoidea]|uniref:Uncharacterized protein n=1 Tax=Botrytis byssoidea TaxID=139641 RepID=A0A9P5I0E2_9HELO|nr:uncharacterized protein EAE97_010889 [Botrytis byssoidea]KAF7923451.1 hypothetical protein EAE97_010889 [Botrytis byssoidea]
MNQPVNNNQPGRSAPMNQSAHPAPMHSRASHSLRDHPTSTSHRPRLVHRNAEEHVALTLRAQRARYDAMMAERDIEYPTMALRSFSNTVAAQVTRDAQTAEVIHALEITQTVEVTQTIEVTNAPQTAEAGLNSLTGNILTTTTSPTSTISSVVVANAQVFSATDSPSSSLGGSPVTMRENAHDQGNNHATVGQVTSSSSDFDMDAFIAAVLQDMQLSRDVDYSHILAALASVEEEENDSTVVNLS